MTMKGILLDNNGDIAFSGLDFAIGEITDQTAETIIVSHYGEIKEKPMLGFGAARLLGGNYDPFWSNEIKESLRKGLIQVASITFTSDGINIETK